MRVISLVCSFSATSNISCLLSHTPPCPGLSFNRINSAAVIFTLLNGANAGCPFAAMRGGNQQDLVFNRELYALNTQRTGDGGVPGAGFDEIKKDIIAILTVSQDFFPADFADTVGSNYGGLMIRLAWHCSGSYRNTDGRGGCDGGRIRFDPELNWPDNVSSVARQEPRNLAAYLRNAYSRFLPGHYYY